MSWDPGRYLQYAGERLRPALDLVARIALASPRAIVDLGCGAGNVTALLAQRWPDADVLGIDNDEAMLAKARASAIGGRVRFRAGDLAAGAFDGRPDIVYSNAALHWAGDHGALLPSLLARVAPGGVLAVQMPRNFGEASHRAVAETAASARWRDTVGALVGPAPVAEPDRYYRWLAPRAASVDIWETVYLQRLPARDDGEHPVVAFVSGTWLVPYFAALGDSRRAAFLDDYRARIDAAYPREPDGAVLFSFRRLFIVAHAR